jgi:tRNA(Ile)-lysidine synthase
MSLKNLSVATKIPKLFNDKLKDKKIRQVYNKFENSLEVKQNFAVAVSGGPDSLALAFLSKIYSIKNRLSPRFYIIDHKLRTESTKEAKKVKKILKKYQINAEILTWKGKKPIKKIQSTARKKRYDLLFNRCDKLGIKNILLGHHQDDLIENFFIRMLRGSGLKGLISLDQKSKIKNKQLLRPLLNQKKNDLKLLSKRIFNFYVEDPSNKDEKYLRIVIRKLIDELEKNGLDKDKILNTIKNLKHSNSIVNFYLNENLQKNTFFNAKEEKFTINQKFFEQPYEIIFRSLTIIINLIGNKYHSVRGKKIDNLINNIKNDTLFKATLGGCIIEKVNHTVIISKEY